jgi:hypothetical protein
LRQLQKPVAVATLDPPVNALRLPAQPKAAPKVEDDPAPKVSVAARKLDPLPLNSAPVIPKQAVKTNVFSTGSSATPTTARAPSQVQTGGFGDPNGIPAKGNQAGVRAGCNACSDARPGRESQVKGPTAHTMKIVGLSGCRC